MTVSWRSILLADVWASQGFDKKIVLPSQKPVSEWGTDELCQFSPALSDLMSYMEATRKNSLAVLAKMDMSKLGEHPVARACCRRHAAGTSWR